MTLRDWKKKLERLSTLPAKKRYNWTDDYCDIFSSGTCPRCQAQIVDYFSRRPINVNYYDVGGHKKELTPIAGMLAQNLTGIDCVECGKCYYKWSVCDSVAPMEIFLTEHSDEYFGSDSRIIDNYNSSIPLTRSLSISKEWSKSYKIDIERSIRSSAEGALGVKDKAQLKTLSEEKIRSEYSISVETKETYKEDVSYNVLAYTRLTIIIKWKRLWQHGFIRTEKNRVPLEIPFSFSKGVTFDQEQISEKNSDADD